jgi:hypothetical protein
MVKMLECGEPLPAATQRNAVTGQGSSVQTAAMTTLDRMIRRTRAWQALRHLRRHFEVWRWQRNGKPNPPPPLIKQQIVKDYARRFGLDTLIETGTYRGDMVNACRETFAQIISIELDDVLFEEAQRRFAQHPHVSILHGDSGRLLNETLLQVSKPSLFWLDGHYCGAVTARGTADTPIIDELRAVLNHPIREHVILIDDARCFDGTSDYPTIDELRRAVLLLRPDYLFEVASDIIRTHQPPKNA